MRTRKKYSKEFKLKAIEISNETDCIKDPVIRVEKDFEIFNE
jgi:transposase-like protein